MVVTFALFYWSYLLCRVAAKEARETADALAAAAPVAADASTAAAPTVEARGNKEDAAEAI